MPFTIDSPAFADGQAIHRQYTCDGEDKSPEIRFHGVPEGTRSLALVCDDPDAPGKTWVHWVIYDIPADATALPEAVPTDEKLKSGARQGRNDFGRVGYGGPCPPRGPAHRYFFKAYALDARLDLPAGKTKAELLKAVEGHVLAEAKWMGTYQRK
jgi:hypothetical protein